MIPQNVPPVNFASKSSYPQGYFQLPANTKFVQIDGKALPITGLAGETRGGFFYPNGGDIGYQIKTRTATQREAYEASRPTPPEPRPTMPEPRPVVSCFQPDSALDPWADWK